MLHNHQGLMYQLLQRPDLLRMLSRRLAPQGRVGPQGVSRPPIAGVNRAGMVPRPTSPYGAGVAPQPTSPYGAGIAPQPTSPYGAGVAPQPTSPYGAGVAPRPMPPIGPGAGYGAGVGFRFPYR